MRKIKYLLMFVLGVGLLSSCLDQTTTYDQNGEGPNLASFEGSSQNLAAIADGVEYTFDLKMKVLGPTSMDLKDDITATIGFDAETSTAVEGTHFRIDNPQITLRADNNHLALFTITMLTDGIITPLDESPVLNLTVTAASGNDNVLPSGKPIKLTLNYACPSFLAGTYDVSTEYTAYDGTVSMLSWTETIAKTGIGEYRTMNVGHWGVGDLDPGTPGFTFTDVCGVLKIDGQNLASYWANWVEGTAPGSVDETTGDLYMEYSICYGGNCRYYKSTYVKQ